MEKEKIVIWGASGHGLVAYDVALQSNYDTIGWIDSYKETNTEVKSLKVLGGTTELLNLFNERVFSKIFIAISNNYTRFLAAQELLHQFNEDIFINLVHPKATIGVGVEMGVGNLIMPNSVVGAFSKLGNFCILNTNSSIDHECIIHDYVSILPNSSLAGNVSVGARTCIAMGCNVVHNVKIGEDSLIGAGSLVINSIPELVVAYGHPAKIIRPRKIEDRHF
jgi:sugar O-acyltransferase (sialic acid O-acetyltransferase NeuD family)